MTDSQGEWMLNYSYIGSLNKIYNHKSHNKLLVETQSVKM